MVLCLEDGLVLGVGVKLLCAYPKLVVNIYIRLLIIVRVLVRWYHFSAAPAVIMVVPCTTSLGPSVSLCSYCTLVDAPFIWHVQYCISMFEVFLCLGSDMNQKDHSGVAVLRLKAVKNVGQNIHFVPTILGRGVLLYACYM